MRTSVSKLDAILTAVAVRLRDQLSLDAATCYLALDPDSIPNPNPGTFFVVVSPTSGSFDEANFAGGGVSQATLQTSVIVRVYSPVQLDEPHHDTQWLTSTTVGIVEQMRRVLKALAGHDLESSGAQILAQPIFPQSQTFGRYSRALGYGELVFGIVFDWDLS